MKVTETEHVFTHNPAGLTVTHADFGDGAPLCGWIGDDETASSDWSAVDCRDCLMAAPSPAPAVRTRAFAGRPESVRAARAWVAGFFAGSPAAADAALMVSELFTNAIKYTASRLPGGLVTVKVAAGDGTARVDVIDQGALPGTAAAHGLGKGLVIVAQLAELFGADGSDRWFAVRTGGAA
jgi:Histidine kinase-like ATPase domain